MARAMLKSGSALVSKRDTKSDEGEYYDYGLFDKGEQWKRQRTFLQTGMLDPIGKEWSVKDIFILLSFFAFSCSYCCMLFKAAKGFLPGIIMAAENASKAAPLHVHDVNEYLNYTAFDMFSCE